MLMLVHPRDQVAGVWVGIENVKVQVACPYQLCTELVQHAIEDVLALLHTTHMPPTGVIVMPM